MHHLRIALARTIDAAFWIALQTFGIECRLADVRRRSYTSHPRELGPINPTETLLKAADAELSRAEARQKAIDEKARMLLTMVSILIPLTTLVLTRTMLPTIALPALLLLFLAASLLVGYLSIRTTMAPYLSQDELQLDEAQLREQLVRDLLRSAHAVEDQVRFFVNVFQAALRAFLLGLLLLAITTVATVCSAQDRNDRWPTNVPAAGRRI